MTATEQREITAMERRIVARLAWREEVSIPTAQAARRERLRRLRTLLLLRFEATRGGVGCGGCAMKRFDAAMPYLCMVVFFVLLPLAAWFSGGAI